MENLKLTITTSPDASGQSTVLKITGPMLLSNLFDFQPAVRAETAPLIVLDLAEVPYMDSAALGSLVHAEVSSTHRGRRLVLACVNERVMTLLKVTNVDRAFKIYATVADALASS
jgi:anti-sigma B factor antagonist